MDSLKIFFPVSGIETYFFFPPLVAFVLSFFTSMGGVSGAFLILPFQMSILGFVSPSVSATNFLYNIVGTPGGIIPYIREQRMVWPLAVLITIGTFPGVLIGYYIRVRYFPDPRVFKLFVGIVLLYIGFRLAKSIGKKKRAAPPHANKAFVVSNVSWNMRRMEFDFSGEKVSFSVPALLSLSFIVGIIGGIYGIGGGAIIAPFCVSILQIPVFTIAGPALFGTFMTSIAGVFFYSTIPISSGQTAPPDWLLGFLFGVGGLFGMYLGARCQKYVPEKIIKAILALIILIVSLKYIVQFF
jgi:uncharacterized membrane protein YfcA